MMEDKSKLEFSKLEEWIIQEGYSYYTAVKLLDGYNSARRMMMPKGNMPYTYYEIPIEGTLPVFIKCWSNFRKDSYNLYLTREEARDALPPGSDYLQSVPAAMLTGNVVFVDKETYVRIKNERS